MNRYPRGTVEYVFFGPVTGNGVTLTDFEYAISRNYDSPEAADFAPVQTVNSKQAFLLDTTDMGVGTYKAWVRASTADEAVIVEAGTFQVVGETSPPPVPAP